MTLVCLTCGVLVSFQVLAAACSVSSLPLVFGAYNPISGSATDSTTMITVACESMTSDVQYAISLSVPGDGRKLTSGNFSLNYELYSDPGRATVWNVSNTVAGIVTKPAGALQNNDSKTVYGRIPANQNSAGAGSYNASPITITVSY